MVGGVGFDARTSQSPAYREVNPNQGSFISISADDTAMRPLHGKSSRLRYEKADNAFYLLTPAHTHDDFGLAEEAEV